MYRESGREKIMSWPKGYKVLIIWEDEFNEGGKNEIKIFMSNKF